MERLYLWLNIGSVCLPFIFSFHPKFKFYKKWKTFFPALFITALLFLIWDIIFTRYGIWGFNQQYLIGITILGLPLEEWLFFICIPYACIFTHYALLFYFPERFLKPVFTRRISYFLTALLIGLVLFNTTKWYTSVNFLYAVIILQLALRYTPEILQAFYLSFLVILIPFFIVNGVLTGSGIENEIVWYDHRENLGIRIFTIPVEDIIYAFSLLLSCLFFMKLSERRLTQ